MINPTRHLKLSAAIPKKVKWGVAGCGHYAESSFLPALLSVQRSKLVSVFSHDINRATSTANKFGAPHAFDNFDSFLESDINIVYISGATIDHYEQIIKAAKASKHILCETPLALSSHQAEEMIKICNDSNVMLCINHLHRFHPHIQKARELIDKHMLGKIVSISASYNIDYAPDNKFRFKKELSGGGALRYLGTQMIDLLRYFGGEIEQTKAFMDNVVYKSEVEDYAIGIVKFKNSGYGNFNVSYNSKKAYNRIEILGHNGAISIEDFGSKKNIATKLIIDLEDEARIVFRKKTNKLLYMIREIQKAIIKKNPSLVSGFDEVVNQKIVEEIEKQCSM